MILMERSSVSTWEAFRKLVEIKPGTAQEIDWFWTYFAILIFIGVVYYLISTLLTRAIKHGPKTKYTMSRGDLIKEFFSALGSSTTYDPYKNIYALFGFLWGLPVPLFAMWLVLRVEGLPPTVSNAVDVWVADPIHILFLLHPYLFSVIFGAIGTIRLQQIEVQEKEIENLRTQEGKMKNLLFKAIGKINKDKVKSREETLRDS